MGSQPMILLIHPMSSKWLQVIAFIAMIFIGTGNRIFMKLQTYPMHDYPFFLTMLTTFIYIPVCFSYILPMLAFG